VRRKIDHTRSRGISGASSGQGREFEITLTFYGIEGEEDLKRRLVTIPISTLPGSSLDAPAFRSTAELADVIHFTVDDSMPFRAETRKIRRQVKITPARCQSKFGAYLSTQLYFSSSQHEHVHTITRSRATWLIRLKRLQHQNQT
jgi:hypothetical protein